MVVQDLAVISPEDTKQLKAVSDSWCEAKGNTDDQMWFVNRRAWWVHSWVGEGGVTHGLGGWVDSWLGEDGLTHGCVAGLYT